MKKKKHNTHTKKQKMTPFELALHEFIKYEQERRELEKNKEKMKRINNKIDKLLE